MHHVKDAIEANRDNLYRCHKTDGKINKIKKKEIAEAVKYEKKEDDGGEEAGNSSAKHKWWRRRIMWQKLWGVIMETRQMVNQLYPVDHGSGSLLSSKFSIAHFFF